MPAYSSTSPPALPGCPLSSRPTVSTQSFVRACSRCHAAVPFNFHCPLSCLKSKTIILGSHICDLRRRASPCRHGVCKLFLRQEILSVGLIPSAGAFMPTVRRCQECGRRLGDVLFCPRCGDWFCCAKCLAADNVRHLRSNLVQVVAIKSAGPDAAPASARMPRLKLNSGG
jgi:hypothetical protein